MKGKKELFSRGLCFYSFQHFEPICCNSHAQHSLVCFEICTHLNTLQVPKLNQRVRIVLLTWLSITWKQNRWNCFWKLACLHWHRFTQIPPNMCFEMKCIEFNAIFFLVNIITRGLDGNKGKENQRLGRIKDSSLLPSFARLEFSAAWNPRIGWVVNLLDCKETSNLNSISGIEVCWEMKCGVYLQSTDCLLRWLGQPVDFRRHPTQVVCVCVVRASTLHSSSSLRDIQRLLEHDFVAWSKIPEERLD